MRNRRSAVGARGYLLVGVTGGIGSGKSEACAVLARRGRCIISADGLAREISENDPGVKEEILDEFGPEVFTPLHVPDRKKLAERVFSDASARRRLNEIIHPRVFRRIDEFLGGKEKAALFPYTVIEAALIFESGMDRTLDYVIVVDAPEGERINRVVHRDGSSREEVAGRIASQMSTHEKRSRADFVVDNTGSLGELAVRMEFLDTLLHSVVANPTKA